MEVGRGREREREREREGIYALEMTKLIQHSLMFTDRMCACMDMYT